MPHPAEVTTERRRAPAGRRLAHSFVSPNSYGIVLGLIVATYVAAVWVDAAWSPSLLVVLQVVTVWFALRTSRVRRGTRRVADVVLALALVAALLSPVPTGEAWRGLCLVSAVLYLIAPVSVIRHLLTRSVVDQETMLGAVAAYLLIGMFFAFVYRSVEYLQAGPFFGSAGVATLPRALFFTFTTLTTTGYGNLVPATNPGQTLAVSEMLIGQLFLIAALGKIVAAWRPARWTTEAVDDADPRTGSTRDEVG
jgi:Ion channel